MTTTMNAADVRRSFDEKVRRGIFNPVARHLPEEVREDRMQEGIALTWAMYRRYAERGEVLDDAVLVHSCRLRATDPSRYLARADGWRKGDVYDVRNYMSGAVEVLRFSDAGDERDYPSHVEVLLDDVLAEDLQRVADAPAHQGFGLAEATSNDPRRKLESAIDLTAWLDELGDEDQELLELRATGFTLEETVVRVDASTSFVFTRCRQLGRALAERMGVAVEARVRGVSEPASSRQPRSASVATSITRSACAA